MPDGQYEIGDIAVLPDNTQRVWTGQAWVKPNTAQAVQALRSMRGPSPSAFQSFGAGASDIYYGARQLAGGLSPALEREVLDDRRVFDANASTGDQLLRGVGQAAMTAPIGAVAALGGSGVAGAAAAGAAAGGATGLLTLADSTDERITNSALGAAGGAVGAVAVPRVLSFVGKQGGRVLRAARRMFNNLSPSARYQIDLQIDEAARAISLSPGDIDRSVRERMRAEAMNALAQGDDLSPTALARRLRMTVAGYTDDAAPTRGQVTRDPTQITLEREAAKRPGGEPIQQRLMTQEARTRTLAESLKNQPGQADRFDAGTAAERAVNRRSAELQRGVRQAYDKARVGYSSALPTPEGEPNLLFHGSPQPLDTLAPGSMLTDNPVRAAGYTTSFSRGGTVESGFSGKIHAATVNAKNPFIVYSLDQAENKLIELAEKTGKPFGTLQQAAKVVHEATGHDAILAVSNGKVVGAIPLVSAKVSGRYDPAASVRRAMSRGEMVPDNLAQLVGQTADDVGGLSIQAFKQRTANTLREFEDSVDGGVKRRIAELADGSRPFEPLELEKLDKMLTESVPQGAAPRVARAHAELKRDLVKVWGDSGYAEAKRLASERFRLLGRRQGIANSLTQDKLAPEQVVQRLMTGRVRDVAQLRRLIGDEPEWAQLQDAVLQKIIARSFRGAGDELSSGRFSPAQFSRIVNDMEKQRLVLLFGPEKATKLRNLANAADDLFSLPSFASVNTSNSGVEIGRMFQRLAQATLGLHPALQVAIPQGGPARVSGQIVGQALNPNAGPPPQLFPRQVMDLGRVFGPGAAAVTAAEGARRATGQ